MNDKFDRENIKEEIEEEDDEIKNYQIISNQIETMIFQ